MRADPSIHTTSSEDLPRSAEELFDNALDLYASMVFWNMKPRRNMDGYRSAISALKEHGDLAAAKLADRMEKAIDHAA